MSKFITIILLIIAVIDPTKIARINDMKASAASAFNQGNFEKSAELYSYLLDSMNVEDENITLNLGHSYFQMDDKDQSKKYYERLITSTNNKIRSLAFQQLGVLAKNPQDLDKSLAYFKESIRANPANKDARYNYELIKKWLKNQEENKEQQNKENSDDKQEPSEYAKRLKEQADRLVLQNLYLDAYNLMQEGLKIDQTVGYYNEFINRTKEVGEIDQ